MLSFIVGSTAAAGTLRVGNGIIKTVGSNSSWKDTSGRESGQSEYKFGDMTKSVLNSFWGGEVKKSEMDITIVTPLVKATPLVKEGALVKEGGQLLPLLKDQLLSIQDEIDKYEEENPSDEAISTYLKRKKKEVKQQIKNLQNRSV